MIFLNIKHLNILNKARNKDPISKKDMYISVKAVNNTMKLLPHDGIAACFFQCRFHESRHSHVIMQHNWREIHSVSVNPPARRTIIPKQITHLHHFVTYNCTKLRFCFFCLWKGNMPPNSHGQALWSPCLVLVRSREFKWVHVCWHKSINRKYLSKSISCWQHTLFVDG